MKSSKCLIALSLLILGTTGTFAEEKCSERSEKRGSKLFDQEFGMALTPDDFLTSIMSPFSSFHSPWFMRDYIRPWRQLASLTRDVGSTIKSEKDKFQINLDVQHFSPDEITVKTVDGYIIVEGKHEEKEDEHGYISRQFVRRYSLPEGTTADSVVSQLSADGVLTVTAPRKEVQKENERIVPITKTGPVRKDTKENVEGSCQAKDCTEPTK